MKHVRGSARGLARGDQGPSQKSYGWEHNERNQRAIESNRPAEAAIRGAAREGTSLLQGLVLERAASYAEYAGAD